MKITKYFCPNCMRFKYWWQTIKGWGESIYPEIPLHCRHCGHKIIEVTKDFVEKAVMDKLQLK